MRSFFVSSLVVASLVLGGCGLRPLYANGSKGAVAQVLADVDVAPIEGHSGWLVRNALRDRLQATQGGHGAGKRLRLDVRLETRMRAFSQRWHERYIAFCGAPAHLIGIGGWVKIARPLRVAWTKSQV